MKIILWSNTLCTVNNVFSKIHKAVFPCDLIDFNHGQATRNRDNVRITRVEYLSYSVMSYIYTWCSKEVVANILIPPAPNTRTQFWWLTYGKQFLFAVAHNLNAHSVATTCLFIQIYGWVYLKLANSFQCLKHWRYFIHYNLRLYCRKARCQYDN